VFLLAVCLETIPVAWDTIPVENGAILKTSTTDVLNPITTFPQNAVSKG
jgi:hypothetical protein